MKYYIRSSSIYSIISLDTFIWNGACPLYVECIKNADPNHGFTNAFKAPKRHPPPYMKDHHPSDITGRVPSKKKEEGASRA